MTHSALLASITHVLLHCHHACQERREKERREREEREAKLQETVSKWKNSPPIHLKMTRVETDQEEVMEVRGWESVRLLKMQLAVRLGVLELRDMERLRGLAIENEFAQIDGEEDPHSFIKCIRIKYKWVPPLWVPPQGAKATSDGELTAAQLAEIRVAFDKIDTDSSGQIDLLELQHGFELLHIEATKDEVNDLFHAADADNSGEIDFEEFSTMISGKVTGGGSLSLMQKFNQAAAKQWFSGWFGNLFTGTTTGAAASPAERSAAKPQQGDELQNDRTVWTNVVGDNDEAAIPSFTWEWNDPTDCDCKDCRRIMTFKGIEEEETTFYATEKSAIDKADELQEDIKGGVKEGTAVINLARRNLSTIGTNLGFMGNNAQTSKTVRTATASIFTSVVSISWISWLVKFNVLKDFWQINSLIVSQIAKKINISFEYVGKIYSFVALDISFIFPTVPPWLNYVGLGGIGLLCVIAFLYLTRHKDTENKNEFDPVTGEKVTMHAAEKGVLIKRSKRVLILEGCLFLYIPIFRSVLQIWTCHGEYSKALDNVWKGATCSSGLGVCGDGDCRAFSHGARIGDRCCHIHSLDTPQPCVPTH